MVRKLNLLDLYKKLCSEEDCTYPAEVRGYCFRHYQLWYRNGKPHPIDVEKSNKALRKLQ